MLLPNSCFNGISITLFEKHNWTGFNQACQLVKNQSIQNNNWATRQIESRTTGLPFTVKGLGYAVDN